MASSSLFSPPLAAISHFDISAHRLAWRRCAFWPVGLVLALILATTRIALKNLFFHWWQMRKHVSLLTKNRLTSSNIDQGHHKGVVLPLCILVEEDNSHSVNKLLKDYCYKGTQPWLIVSHLPRITNPCICQGFNSCICPCICQRPSYVLASAKTAIQWCLLTINLCIEWFITINMRARFCNLNVHYIDQSGKMEGNFLFQLPWLYQPLSWKELIRA